MPSFRTEMDRGIDLVEEVGRIHGYDEVPATLPTREARLSTVVGWDRGAEVEGRLRDVASAAGCLEVVNSASSPRPTSPPPSLQSPARRLRPTARGPPGAPRQPPLRRAGGDAHHGAHQPPLEPPEQSPLPGDRSQALRARPRLPPGRHRPHPGAGALRRVLSGRRGRAAGPPPRPRSTSTTPRAWSRRRSSAWASPAPASSTIPPPPPGSTPGPPAWCAWGAGRTARARWTWAGSARCTRWSPRPSSSRDLSGRSRSIA